MLIELPTMLSSSNAAALPVRTADVRNEDYATQSEAKVAISKFTHAVERRMKPTLDAAIVQRDIAIRKLAELQQCQTALDVVLLSTKYPNPNVTASYPGEEPAFLETRVNIGEEFYVQAHVFNAQPLIVDVGLGIYVEMSVQEVESFYESKRGFLCSIVDFQSGKINDIRTHLEQVMSNLSKLKTETATASLIAQLSQPPGAH